MEVDPKPSPWPCVVMLVGLLLCCLTVPLCWQAGNSPPSAPPEQSNEVPFDLLAEHNGNSSPRNPTSDFEFNSNSIVSLARRLPENHLISLNSPPTIEELVDSAQMGAMRFGLDAGWRHADWSRWPMIAVPMALPQEAWPAAVDPADVAPVEPNPLVVAALQRVGKLLATYSVSDAFFRLAVRAGQLRELWPSVPTQINLVQPPTASAQESAPFTGPPEASTLRLLDPNDRSALLPEPISTVPTFATPTIPVPEASPSTPAPELNTQLPPLPPTIAENDADAVSENDPWCVPQTLLDQLERLTHHSTSAEWASDTLNQLQAVTARENWDQRDLSQWLESLARATQIASRMAEQTQDTRLRVELLRARWALSRRVDCWRAIGDIQVASRASQRIATRGSLQSLFQGLPPQPAIRPDVAVLTGHIEAYESNRDPLLARQVVQDQHSLRSSPDRLDQSLADAVEQHYRNANVRIAITAEMLNRFVADERSEMRPVHDRIADTPVHGQSVTRSQSRVRLQPATGYWQLNIETNGVVESDTIADGGRACLRTFGATDFTAQRSVVVGAEGVRIEDTRIGTTNHSQLAGVSTEYDWVPLFGAFARSKAVDQYRAKRPRAKAETEAKVASQTVNEIDRETGAAIDRIEQAVRSRYTDSIARFDIAVTPIELTTTEERLVARLRVAGNHQLGSHTPRPRALSDSLASLQLHESALTNAAVSLELDGARFTAPELQELLRRKFPEMALAKPTESRTDTVFEFAYRDALQLRIADGRLEMLLALANFEHEGRSTSDFIVHAFYTPVVNGLNVELERSGPLGIEGRLSAGDRARLHNAFNTVFSADRRLPVVRLESYSDQRLNGLMITQLVLEDGWLGMAVGPATANRTAERSRSLR